MEGCVSDPLKIGRISYLNLLPVFRSLEELEGDRYVFVEGYPSELNRMLRKGELDISPSSSIEYLRDKGSYGYLSGHSISSRGAVRSILLFSRTRIEDICNQPVMATHQSETSIALLRILLKKFYGLDCAVEITKETFNEAISRSSAYLTIGDDALKTFQGATVMSVEKPAGCHAICTMDNQTFFVYDLGELWHMHTGLPSVFALWTYRKGLSREKRDGIEAFRVDLTRATEHAMTNLDRIARENQTVMPPEDAVSYWKGIIYGLPDDCIEGLNLFEKYLRESGQL